jgi:hypothetical protein
MSTCSPQGTAPGLCLSPQNFQIVEKNQNSLKGIAWQAAGMTCTTGALVLTAATVGLAAVSVFGALGSMDAGSSLGLTASLGLGTAAIAVDYVAIKVTGGCYSNAMHHLGDRYQVQLLK